MQIVRLLSLPSSRVKIYFADNSSLVVPLELAVAHRLKPGLELSETEFQELKNQSNQANIINKSINWALIRPRSVKEFKRYAYKLQLSTEQTEQVQAKLVSLDLLNDTKFASWWVENRQTFRPKSTPELKQELRSKGIDVTTIDQLTQDIDQAQLVRQIATKYLKKLSRFDSSTQKQKLLAYLARRGFSYSLSLKVVDSLL